MLKKIINFYQAQELIAFWSVLFCSISALLLTVFLVFNIYTLPPQLPLYYSLPWGERQLASLPEFVIIPGLIVTVSLINLFISTQLHNSQLLTKRILSISSLIFTLLLLISSLKIIFTFI